MRFVICVVLGLSVGIGAYLGSARAAGSATAPVRVVHLRVGDIAAAGQVQCRAWTDSRSHPVHAAYLECSKGPWSRAALSVYVLPGGVDVLKKVGQVQCVWQGLRERDPTFSTYLRCTKGPRRHVAVSVEVLPGGIAVSKKGKIVYRTGWNPGR